MLKLKHKGIERKILCPVKLYILFRLCLLSANISFIFEERTSKGNETKVVQTSTEQFYSITDTMLNSLLVPGVTRHNFVSFSSGMKAISPLDFYTLKSILYKIFLWDCIF